MLRPDGQSTAISVSGYPRSGPLVGDDGTVVHSIRSGDGSVAVRYRTALVVVRPAGESLGCVVVGVVVVGVVVDGVVVDGVVVDGVVVDGDGVTHYSVRTGSGTAADPYVTTLISAAAAGFGESVV